jgi:hypothetical protein
LRFQIAHVKRKKRKLLFLKRFLFEETKDLKKPITIKQSKMGFLKISAVVEGIQKLPNGKYIKYYKYKTVKQDEKHAVIPPFNPIKSLKILKSPQSTDKQIFLRVKKGRTKRKKYTKIKYSIKPKFILKRLRLRRLVAKNEIIPFILKKQISKKIRFISKKIVYVSNKKYLVPIINNPTVNRSPINFLKKTKRFNLLVFRLIKRPLNKKKKSLIEKKNSFAQLINLDKIFLRKGSRKSKHYYKRIGSALRKTLRKDHLRLRFFASLRSAATITKKLKSK